MKSDIYQFPARYYRLWNPKQAYHCDERSFQEVDVDLKFRHHETALILIDCWNKHYCKSSFERSEVLIKENIIPLLNTMRSLNMCIIHVPASNVATKHPQHKKLLDPSDKEQATQYSQPDPAWPPKSFKEKKYDLCQLDFERTIPLSEYEKEYEDLKISPLLEPTENDFVAISGSHMHRILKQQKVLHLIYVGFATNMCIHYRDYGMRAMDQKGYNNVLLRDCTTGIEFHDTVDTEMAKHLAIREIEYKYGFSALSSDLLKSLKASQA